MFRDFFIRQLTCLFWHVGDKVGNRYSIQSNAKLVRNTKQVYRRWDDSRQEWFRDQFIWEALDDENKIVTVAVGYNWK